MTKSVLNLFNANRRSFGNGQGMDPTMAIILDHISDLLSHLSRKGLSLIVLREMGHGCCVQVFNIIGGGGGGGGGAI